MQITLKYIRSNTQLSTINLAYTYMTTTNKNKLIYYLFNGKFYECRLRYVLVSIHNTETPTQIVIDTSRKNNGVYIETICAHIKGLGNLVWCRGRKFRNDLDPNKIFTSISNAVKNKSIFRCYDIEICYFNYDVMFSPIPPHGCFWYPFPFNDKLFNLCTWEWNGVKPICKYVKSGITYLLTDKPCFDLVNKRWVIERKKYYATYKECLSKNQSFF